jgi:cytidylate kinase
MSHAMVITIDGAAGTGKTTVSQGLAQRLGWTCLDTGAMYRAVALIAIDRSIDPTDGVALADMTRELGMVFDFTVSPPRLVVDGSPVGDRIRDLDVGSIVSIVAAQPPVRSVLVALQREVANCHPRLVSEGRDQGSVVFPDAMIRFYLTADATIRTRRRSLQLEASGKKVDPTAVAKEIEDRDRIDSTRAEAPLIKPDGAVVVDTSTQSSDEVIKEMEDIVRAILSEGDLS